MFRYKPLRDILFSFLVFNLLVAGAVSSSHARDAFSIVTRWPIGGSGGWDQLTADSRNHLLYMTRGDKIIVVNTNSGKAIGQIEGSKSTHAIVLNPDGQLGYFTDGVDNVARVFNRATLKVIASISTGIDADAIAFDTASNTLLVLNDQSGSATLIDAPSNRAAATVALPGRPAGAVVDGEGSAFVNINDGGRIARIDLRTRSVVSSWKLSGCVGPSGLAINRGLHILYSVCENNRLLSVNARDGRLISQAELPEGIRNIAFDERRNLLFVPSGGGILTVLKAESSGAMRRLQSLQTMPGARTLAVDAITGDVFLPSAAFGLRTGDTSEELRFRPTPVANSFVVLVVGRQQQKLGRLQ